MSEEKKAIEIIEELLRSNEPICEYMLRHQEIDAMRTLLNLIENQQKEIEQEKRKNKELEIIIGEYKNACDNVCEIERNMINNLYISKSKLKDLFEKSNAHPVKLYSDIKELIGE